MGVAKVWLPYKMASTDEAQDQNEGSNDKEIVSNYFCYKEVSKYFVIGRILSVLGVSFASVSSTNCVDKSSSHYKRAELSLLVCYPSCY